MRRFNGNVMILLMAAVLVTTACASSGVHKSPEQVAYETIRRADTARVDILFEAGKAHAQGAIDNNQLGKIRAVAEKLDAACVAGESAIDAYVAVKRAGISIGQSPDLSAVTKALTELVTVWSEYHGNHQ